MWTLGGASLGSLKRRFAGLCALFGGLSMLQAAPVQITATGSYTQNFNTLATTGTANTWTNDTTLPAWYAEQASGTFVLRAGDGGVNTGGLYSFGTGTAVERALGSTSSGTPGTITFGMQVQNSTVAGQTMTLGTLSFTGEQWRNGGNTTPQNLTMWYKTSPTLITGLTPSSDSGWTQLGSLTFVSLVNNASPAGLDGNAAANRTALSASLAGITVARGEYLMLRWKDIDDTGNDHGFGVDDLSLSWTVTGSSNQVPEITSALTATAEAGVAGFSYQITALNSPTSYGASGLPAGLAVNTTSGLITGTPDKNTPGQFPVQLSATNGQGTGTANLVLTVNPNAGAPVVTAASTTAVLAQNFTYQVVASGSPTTYTATGLPSWATLNPTTGVISGVPNATGVSDLSVQAANALGTSLPKTVTITVGRIPVISQSSGSIYASTASTFRIFASDSPTVYTATGLPSGLVLDQATGIITGTISSAGTFTFPISATNAFGTGEGVFTLKVMSAAEQSAIPMSVVVNEYRNSTPDQLEVLVLGNGTPGSTADLRGMVVKDFSNNLVDDNGGKYEFANAGTWNAVPAGTLIVLSAGTGQTEDTDASDFLLRANLGNTSAFTSLGGTFDIAGTDMVMIKAAGAGAQGVAGGVHALAAASGSPTQYAAFTGNKIKATTTPGTDQGVAADNATSSAADFSGSGTATGALASSTFGAGNNASNQAFISQLRTTPSAPVITSALTASGSVGGFFSYTITASGNPTSFGATGLPDGLSLSGAVISGTPSATGTTAVTITATNGLGSDSKQLQLTINPFTQNQTITFGPLSSRTYGDANFTLTATASSGLPVSYASSNTGVATVSGSTVTIHGAGNTVITASQAGSGEWPAAPPVQQTLVVSPKSLTVSGLAAVNKVYDATPVVALTGTPVLAGVLSGDSVTVSGGTGNCAASSVGTGIPVTVSGLTLGGAAAADYTVTPPSNLTVTITKRALTVKANAAGKLTGAADPVLTFSMSGLLETSGLTGTPARTAGETSGTYSILQGSLTASGNYTMTFQGANFTITTPYSPPASYYTAANGKVGTDLKASLNTIIKTGFRSIPYGTGSSTGINGIVPVMKNLYEDPANTSNLILIYGGESFPKSAFGASGSGVWNREHCWPQSFGAATGYAQSDLFHMRPVRGDVNSDRNNDVYGYVANDTGANTAPACRELEAVMWEPPDNEKGQLARGILYMAVRYEGAVTGDGGTADLELIDNASDSTAADELFGKLTDMLAWNRAFPPNEKERRINQQIYTQYQLNRNPFIDNPDYAEMVFRNIPSIAVSLGQNASETGLVAGKVVLKRAGPTTSPLTVNYTFGGSATPGTDTLSLGTAATFSAGSDTVEIPITPVADTLIEGTEVLTLTLASSTSYISSANSATVAISDAPVDTGKTDQIITFAAFTGTPVYGDPAIALGASASSGLTVSYSSSNTSVATVSGSTLTIVGAGITTITAQQPGNVSYNAALPVERVLTVDTKPLSVFGAVAQGKVYDGSAEAIIGGTVSLVGVVSGDSVTLGSAAAVFESKDVGTSKPVQTGYTLSGAQANRYSIVQPTGLSASISVASLNVTGTTVVTRPYDGNTTAMLAGGTLQGVFGEDEVALGANPTGTFSSAQPGTWSVTTSYTIEGVDVGNYVLTQPAGLTGVITPAGGFASWASSYGLAGADAQQTADPDHDGLNNANEYAFGLNPIQPGGQAVKVVASSATSLTISFMERSGVAYTVQSGTDLTTWPGTVTPTVSADQTDKISPDYTRYEATLTTPEGRGFMRVRAVVP